MNKCPKCNNEISEGSQFCANCGERIYEMIFCPNCGKETSSEFAFCQCCGASIVENGTSKGGTNVSEKLNMNSAKELVDSLLGNLKALPKKMLVAVGGIVLVVMLIVIASILMNSGNSNYALYIKDQELFYNNLKKNSDSIEVSKDLFGDLSSGNSYGSELGAILGWYTYMSEDGSMLFYPDKLGSEDGFTIYYKQVKKLGDEDATKIDSNIISYEVNDSDTIVTYIKGYEGNLYQYDLNSEDKEKIASAVSEYAVSEDGKTIVFYTEEGGLYIKKNNAEKEKLASEISSVVQISEDLSTIYYMKEGTLYKHVVGKDKEKIASDVYDVIDVYESGEAYYFKNENSEICLLDYVYDDMEEVDAAIVEPERPERPSWWYFDGTYDEYEAAVAEYEAAYEAYEVAYESYYAKYRRDNLRESLAETTIGQTQYTLCYFDGKKEVQMTDSFTYDYYDTTYYAASKNAVLVFEAYNQSEFEKLKLSEISSIYDVESMVKAALFSTSEVYVAVKSDMTVVEQENAYSFDINESGTLIYYLDEVAGDNNYGELYQIAVKNGKVEKAKLYDSDVYLYNNYFITDTEYLYFKEYQNYAAELYLNKEKIDFDVYTSLITYNSSADEFFYLVDYDSSKNAGTLKIYSDGKAEKISDDVATFSFAPDGKVLYLYDYSTNYYKGELHFWDNGKTEKIDDDVSAIIPISANGGLRNNYGW